MKPFIICACVAVLSGCAANNPVLSTNEWDALPETSRAEGGAIFALPQTRIEFAHSINKKTFTAGDHTEVVDACRVNSSFKSQQPICGMLLDAGIEKSARLSDEKTRYRDIRLCESDAGVTEVRLVPAEGPTWLFGSVPDPTETYIVPLKRGYFQTFDFSMELSNGTISKGSLSTENLGAQDIVGALAKLASIYLGGGAEVTPKEGQPPQDPRPVFPVLQAPQPNRAAVAAARHDLKALKLLLQRRDVLAAQNTDELLVSRSVLLTELNAQIARALAKFTGTVKERAHLEEKVNWIPSRGESVRPLAGATTGKSPDPSFDACGDDSKRRPRWLSLVVAEREAGMGLAPLASGTFTTKSVSGTGWPYRVPEERQVVYSECASFAEFEADKPAGVKWTDMAAATCESHEGRRVSLPQFGQTFRLPSKTGGRKSVIAPEYAADGSLTKLTINHVGESPAPFISAARDLAMPGAKVAKPTEIATLTSQAELIEARQALCRLVLGVSVDDAACKGTNPPTVAPSED